MTEPVPDEQAVRVELEEVRGQIVGGWDSGDALTGREIAGSVIGGFAITGALLMTGASFYVDDGAPRATAAAAGILALLLCLLAFLALRRSVMRRVRMTRDVRRLRRRERRLIALLPAGTAGPSSYGRYYRARFSNPVMVVLYVSMAVVLVLTLLR